MNTENKTPEQYIQEIETDTIIPLHSRSEPFKKAFDIYDKQGNIKKREEMRWNIWLFDMGHLYRGEIEKGFPSKRFGSLFSKVNKEGKGYFYPDISQFPDEAFKYFDKKIRGINNPIHKAQYADILWDQKNDYKAALIAIDSYISCAEIYWGILNKDKKRYDDPNYICYALDMVDALTRAINISSSISRPELLEKVYLKDLDILENLYSINLPRWYIEIIESILDVRDIEKKVDLSKLEKYLKHGREEYFRLNDFHIMRSFIELSIAYFKKIKKDETEVKKLQIDICESFVKEAELRLKGNNVSYLVSAMFYQNALECFREIGETARLDELKLKIKNCYENAKEKEFTRIESKITIKKEDIDKYLEPIKNCSLNDILLYIGLDKSLRPNYEKAKESAENQAKKYVFSSLVNKVIVRNQNPVYKTEGEDDRLKEKTIWNYVMDYNVLSIFLSIIFEKLKKDKLNIESLCEYFYSRDFLISESKFIKQALERYFEKDYVSFLHISVVRVESILRNFLRILNISTTSERDGKIQEKTLDVILDIPELQYVLGDDVVYFLKIFLSSKEGTNLRHDIAHGLVDFETCDELRSNLIIYMWLIFATYKIEERKSNNKSVL